MPVGTLSVRTYKLVVAPADVLATDEVTTIDSNTGNLISVNENDTDTGLNLSALDFKFKVKRTLKAKPNTAVVSVYGLKESSRLYLSTPKKLSMSLEVGYNGENELIFLGEVRNSYSMQEHAENITVMETGDSEKVMQAAGMNLTFGSQSISFKSALNAIQATIPQIMSGSQVAAWQKQNAVLAQVNAAILHPKGGAIDRKSTRYLDNICKSLGLEWSVQNGAVTIFSKDTGENNQDIVLDENSGLIGSPSVDNNGFLEFKSLILKGMHPGACVQIKSKNTNGRYRLESCEWEGGNQAGHREWYIKCLATNPKNAQGQKTGF